MSARVLKICVSETKGIQKKETPSVKVVKDFGIEGDAHAVSLEDGKGLGHRQISLLANESAQIMRDKGVNVGPGDFGENLLTEGIDLVSLGVGTQLKIGQTILEVTQIGKECHTRCAIYYAAGDCVMPTKGIFCKVIQGGTLVPNTPIQVL